MMINYYCQNEMRTKIAIIIVSLLSLRYDHFVTESHDRVNTTAK